MKPRARFVPKILFADDRPDGEVPALSLPSNVAIFFSKLAGATELDRSSVAGMVEFLRKTAEECGVDVTTLGKHKLQGHECVRNGEPTTCSHVAVVEGDDDSPLLFAVDGILLTPEDTEAGPDDVVEEEESPCRPFTPESSKVNRPGQFILVETTANRGGLTGATLVDADGRAISRLDVLHEGTYNAIFKAREKADVLDAVEKASIRFEHVDPAFRSLGRPRVLSPSGEFANAEDPEKADLLSLSADIHQILVDEGRTAVLPTEDALSLYEALDWRTFVRKLSVVPYLEREFDRCAARLMICLDFLNGVGFPDGDPDPELFPEFGKIPEFGRALQAVRLSRISLNRGKAPSVRAHLKHCRDRRVGRSAPESPPRDSDVLSFGQELADWLHGATRLLFKMDTSDQDLPIVLRRALLRFSAGAFRVPASIRPKDRCDRSDRVFNRGNPVENALSSEPDGTGIFYFAELGLEMMRRGADPALWNTLAPTLVAMTSIYTKAYRPDIANDPGYRHLVLDGDYNVFTHRSVPDLDREIEEEYRKCQSLDLCALDAELTRIYSEAVTYRPR